MMRAEAATATLAPALSLSEGEGRAEDRLAPLLV